MNTTLLVLDAHERKLTKAELEHLRAEWRRISDQLRSIEKALDSQAAMKVRKAKR